MSPTKGSTKQATIASVGPRFGAAVVDTLVPALLGGGWYALAQVVNAGSVWVLSVAFCVLLAAWLLVQWWAYGTRRAGFGYRLFRLELVGLKDGKAIGWWRMFLRTIILFASWALVLPGIALCIFIVTNERRQGWHDLAVGSLVVLQRQQNAQATRQPDLSRSATSTVSMPQHLMAASYQAPDELPAAPIEHAPLGQPVEFQPPSAAPGWGAPTGGSQPSAPGWQPSASQQTPAQQAPIQQAPVFQAQHVTQPPTFQPDQHERPERRAPQPVDPRQPLHSDDRPAEPMRAQRSQPEPFGAPTQDAGPHAQPQQSVPEQPLRTRPRALPDEDQGTRLIAADALRRPVDQGWRVRLDNGQSIAVTSTVLIGRNPVAREDETEVELLPAGEPAGTVSKTHLLIGVDERGIYVTDRGSTNGTALVSGTGELTPCWPNTPVRIGDGQVISFGDRTLQVFRG